MWATDNKNGQSPPLVGNEQPFRCVRNLASQITPYLAHSCLANACEMFGVTLVDPYARRGDICQVVVRNGRLAELSRHLSFGAGEYIRRALSLDSCFSY